MAEESAVPESTKRALRRLLDLRERYEKARRAKIDAENAKNDQERYVAELLGSSVVTEDLGEGYGRRQFKRRSTRYGRIIDLDKALEYFEAQGGGGGIVEKKLRKKAINDLVKEALDHNQDLPPGIDFYVDRGVTVTRR